MAKSPIQEFKLQTVSAYAKVRAELELAKDNLSKLEKKIKDKAIELLVKKPFDFETRSVRFFDKEVDGSKILCMFPCKYPSLTEVEAKTIFESVGLKHTDHTEEVFSVSIDQGAFVNKEEMENFVKSINDFAVKDIGLKVPPLKVNKTLSVKSEFHENRAKLLSSENNVALFESMKNNITLKFEG